MSVILPCHQHLKLLVENRHPLSGPPVFYFVKKSRAGEVGEFGAEVRPGD